MTGYYQCVEFCTHFYLFRSISHDKLVINLLSFGIQFVLSTFPEFFDGHPELDIFFAKLSLQESFEKCLAIWIFEETTD